jgi:two-component system response regulator RegX3
MKILIVEDSAPLRAGLVDLVEEAGHTLEAVGDGLSAIRRGVDTTFDLVLLDLMLPGRDGIQVCRRLREARPDLLILILTARGSEDDKVKGLRAGADDYLTKPFGARELLARIDALSRRVNRDAPVPAPMEFDGCRFDLVNLEARRGTEPIPLTPREAGILRLLHHHRGRPVSRSELLEEIWHARGDMMTRTVDMAVAKLRRKIESDPAQPRIVVTIKGAGYAWGDR